MSGGRSRLSGGSADQCGQNTAHLAVLQSNSMYKCALPDPPVWMVGLGIPLNLKSCQSHDYGVQGLAYTVYVCMTVHGVVVVVPCCIIVTTMYSIECFALWHLISLCIVHTLYIVVEIMPHKQEIHKPI